MTLGIEKLFIQNFNQVAKAVHENSVKHGFWTADQKHEAIKLALIHTEISEALEAFRTGDPQDDHIPEFKAGEAELADAVIRIMDLAEDRGYKLAEAIVKKHAFNLSRPKKHGKRY